MRRLANCLRIIGWCDVSIEVLDLYRGEDRGPMERNFIKKHASLVVSWMLEKADSIGGLDHRLTKGQLRELFVARLWPLGCHREAMDQQLKSFSRKLHQLCLGIRVHQITGAPEMPPYHGQTVCEGRLDFAIPGRDRHRDLTTLAQPQRQHGGDGEEGQQDRGRTGDGLVRPLTWRFYPEMRPGLLKGYFHRPAHHHPRQDLLWRGLQVGTKKGLHPQFALGVRHSH